MRRLIALGAVLALTVTSSACAAARAGDAITVLAAASLTEVFNTLGAAFEKNHPGVRVEFSYGGSSTLAAQIVAGAPADVFASASTTTMRIVTDAHRAVGQPVVFTRNQLVIAVPAGNPKHVTGLADLTGLKVALCAPAVPCGAAARTALATAGIAITPVTQEPNVKAALSKVELGEVDAALVYRTDVGSARGAVTGVEFPESASAINDYPIVALTDAPDPTDAAAFVAFVCSPDAAAALRAAGFQPAGSAPASPGQASPGQGSPGQASLGQASPGQGDPTPLASHTGGG